MDMELKKMQIKERINLNITTLVCKKAKNRQKCKLCKIYTIQPSNRVDIIFNNLIIDTKFQAMQIKAFIRIKLINLYFGIFPASD